MSDPISEDWLRACGFKWEQLDRQPSKHWLLWLGLACTDPNEPGRRMFGGPGDIGVEVAHNEVAGSDFWFCWVRSDTAGRYSRFLHVRHIATQDELIRLIEGLTGREWNPADCMYGSFHAPETAERLRKDAERLDLVIARQRAEFMDRKNERDPDKRGIVSPQLQGTVKRG